jgi:hypothetical protein
MLHAGLDLSRKKVDVCLLSGQGEQLAQLAVPPDADGLRGLARRIEESYGEPVCAVIESMTGARFVHDTLEQAGWAVEIADAQKVKGLAPLACKTDRIDSRVLATLSQRDLVAAIWLPDQRRTAQVDRPSSAGGSRLLSTEQHRGAGPRYDGHLVPLRLVGARASRMRVSGITFGEASQEERTWSSSPEIAYRSSPSRPSGRPGQASSRRSCTGRLTLAIASVGTTDTRASTHQRRARWDVPGRRKGRRELWVGIAAIRPLAS